MLKRKKIFNPLTSRRKGSRWARNITDFACTAVFNTADHVIDFGIGCCKRIGSGIFACRRRKSAGSGGRNGSNAVFVDQRQPHFMPVDKKKIQQVGFDDVVGLKEAKKEAWQRAVIPVKYEQKAKMFEIVENGGILLVGPAGNGKSLLAKAVANAVQMEVFEITAKDILRTSQVESARMVSELFKTARSFERVAIIINEIEGFLRESSSDIIQTVNSQFLNESDGFLKTAGKNKMLLMFGTSNKPEIMRAAAKRPGRFELIFVGLPSYEDRLVLLKKRIEGLPVSDGIDYGYICENTRLFSCADISSGVIEKVKRRALNRSTKLKGENEISPICMGDFVEVLDGSQPSVRGRDIEKWYPGGLDALT